jgi:hypothetical protein
MVGFIVFPQISAIAQLVDGQAAGFSNESLDSLQRLELFFPPLSVPTLLPHTASYLLCLVGSDEWQQCDATV